MSLPRLLLLTDRHQMPPGRDLVETLRRCLGAGTSGVVLRELDLDDDARTALVGALGPSAQVIAARTPLAGAAGVHLASHQRADEARGRPFGRSCHHPDDVARAVTEGAGWVSISPVAPTASKPGYGPPLGAEGVSRAVEVADGVPVYALGGVDAASVAGLRAAGAYGVAVMGAVMRAVDPAAVVADLLAGFVEAGQR